MNEIVKFCEDLRTSGRSNRLKLYLYPEAYGDEVVGIKIRFQKNFYKQDGPIGAWYKTLVYYIQGNGIGDNYVTVTTDATAYSNGVVDVAINPHNAGYSDEKVLETLRSLVNQTFPNVLGKK